MINQDVSKAGCRIFMYKTMAGGGAFFKTQKTNQTRLNQPNITDAAREVLMFFLMSLRIRYPVSLFEQMGEVCFLAPISRTNSFKRRDNVLHLNTSPAFKNTFWIAQEKCFKKSLAKSPVSFFLLDIKSISVSKRDRNNF